MLSLNWQELFRKYHTLLLKHVTESHVLFDSYECESLYQGFPVFSGVCHNGGRLFKPSGRIQFSLELEVWEYYPGFHRLFQIVNISSLKKFFCDTLDVSSGCVSFQRQTWKLWFDLPNPQTKMQNV